MDLDGPDKRSALTPIDTTDRVAAVTTVVRVSTAANPRTGMHRGAAKDGAGDGAGITMVAIAPEDPPHAGAPIMEWIGARTVVRANPPPAPYGRSIVPTHPVL
jgi:hypothetical protein